MAHSEKTPPGFYRSENDYEKWKKLFRIWQFVTDEPKSKQGGLLILKLDDTTQDEVLVEEFSRRCFFRNHLITFLNDELYSQTKVLVKKISIFENSGRGRPKNDDFWHFRE